MRSSAICKPALLLPWLAPPPNAHSMVHAADRQYATISPCMTLGARLTCPSACRLVLGNVALVLQAIGIYAIIICTVRSRPRPTSR